MGISDWSSDVGSSDLPVSFARAGSPRYSGLDQAIVESAHPGRIGLRGRPAESSRRAYRAAVGHSPAFGREAEQSVRVWVEVTGAVPRSDRKSTRLNSSH